MNFFENANRFIRQSEASAVNLLSAIAPWLAPLAPASMAYQSMQDRLGFSQPVSLALAIVIEILGLATVATTLDFWQHNRRQRAEYKKMPVALAGGMFAFYLAVILTVNVILDLPNQSPYIPIVARFFLTLLSVPAAVTLAIRTQHTELLAEISSGKTESKSGKKPETFHPVSVAPESPPQASAWPELTTEDKRKIAGMDAAQIAGSYGVTPRTARNWRSRVTANGNGHNAR